MLSFDPDAIPSHDALGLDIPENDPLTPEAFHNEKCPATSQWSFISLENSKLPEVSPSSDENSKVTQPIDSKNNPIITDLRTSIPGERASATSETTENLPFVIKEKEHLKSSKPKATPGFENHNQRRGLTSPEFKFLEVQDIKREALQKYKRINN
ncbi:uncharacterized protein N7498_001656 [Penicillium cinerascens]|uniref:Uncharacterized protein n=1 Tax=Penicillium cinerascens TaxID=70096 RepID=A0A9W9N8K7_9EURO|nr:uncharacterized protein N7498_001656 [Penicillium cinerascens]KAJ5215249.1 hypothetical protein N7498_001656 [Penicillium cinerascens]